MASSPCYICGRGMSDLRLDSRDMKTRPCATCEEIIQDAVGGGGDPLERITWGEFASIFDTTDVEQQLVSESTVGNPQG